MVTAPIEDQLTALMEERAEHGPEGISVLVVGTTDTVIAAEVGPMLAERLYPSIRFGKVLHIEAQPEGGFEVVVEHAGDRRVKTLGGAE